MTAEQQPHRGELKRWVITVLVVTLVFRIFLLRIFQVPSQSMEPTLQMGDRIVVSPVASSVRELQHGDVVVFRSSGVWDPALPSSVSGWKSSAADLLGLPGGSKYVVKRIVGLPGDQIQCCAPDGRLLRNGEPIGEGYLQPSVQPSNVNFDVTLGEGRVWVMGDNRAQSADSRAHLGSPGGGSVPVESIVGEVEFIAWPLGRLSGHLGD